MSRLNPLVVVRRRPVLTALSILLMVALALWVPVLIREPPEKLLNRARRSSGDERVTLLIQAVDGSGGVFPQAQLELCLALARARKTEQLLAAFPSLPLQECPPSELLSLAALCIRAEQWAIADECLRAISQRPHDIVARLTLQCEVYAFSSQLPQLVQSATELTTLAPDSPAGWWFLAQAHEKRQNTMEALVVYRNALSHHLPTNDQMEMRHRLFEHSIEIGDAETARVQRDLIAASSRTDVRLDVYDARLLHLEGHPAEALRSINNAIGRIGKISEALRLRGILYLELDELEKAIADLKEAAALSPEDEVNFFKLAEAFRRLASRDKAPAHLTTAETFLSEYHRLHAEKLERLGLQH